MPGIRAYALGIPLFRKATVHLENGKTFRIRVPNVPANNIDVRSVMLNEKPLNRFRIRYAEILAGGELIFEMISERKHSSPSDHKLPS